MRNPWGWGFTQGFGEEALFSNRVIDYLGASSFVGYWKLDETSGTTAFDISPQGNDGAYTGVTPANELMPPKVGGRAPLFDGANDYVDIYSAGFNSDFDGQEFSIIALNKVSGVGVWSDGVYRNVCRLLVDGSNFVDLAKSDADQIYWRYTAGGTSEILALAETPLDWYMQSITVTKTGDAVKAFYNSSQTGTTQTGLGTWAGSLSSTVSLIGANAKTPSGVWDGWLGHIIILNRAATPTEIAQVAAWAGV